MRSLHLVTVLAPLGPQLLCQCLVANEVGLGSLHGAPLKTCKEMWHSCGINRSETPVNGVHFAQSKTVVLLFCTPRNALGTCHLRHVVLHR